MWIAVWRNIVKQELQLFDSTTNHSLNIIKLALTLTLIPLSSVEAERVFSTARLFIAKLNIKVSIKV